jgi:hypothetical protein
MKGEDCRNDWLGQTKVAGWYYIWPTYSRDAPKITSVGEQSLSLFVPEHSY